jgi:hypothetical protein
MSQVIEEVKTHYDKETDGKILGYKMVKCDCGEEVVCQGFTSSCECGADYNWNGDQLAPRSQWGEETGESIVDIYNGSDDYWF